MSTRTRAAGAAALALVTSLVLAVPAAASSAPGGVMEQDPSTMPLGSLLLIVIGIPVLVAVLVWLLVSAPGWTRDGRTSDLEAWTGEPVVVGGESAAPALEAGGSAADEAGGTGGTSAGW